MALSQKEKTRRKMVRDKKKLESQLVDANVTAEILTTLPEELEAPFTDTDDRLESLKEAIAERTLTPHRTAFTIDKIDGYWHCIQYKIVDDEIVDADYGDQMLRADAFNTFKINAARTLFGIIPTKPGEL